MRRLLLPVCGAALLLSSQARPLEPVPGPRDPVIHRAFVESVWIEHLWLQVNTFRDQPRSMERYVRKILLFRPTDREALKRMIRITRERGEIQWGLALCRWVDLLDPNDPEKNFLTRQLEEAYKNARLLAPPNVTRLEVLEAAILEAGTAGDRNELRDAESQLRELLASHRVIPDPDKETPPPPPPDAASGADAPSTDDPPEAPPTVPGWQDPHMFKRLAMAYDALEESGLALAAWWEALRHDPADFVCVRRTLELLESTSMLDHLDEALKYTTPTQYVDRTYNALVGKIMVRNQLGWKALPWLGRWCALEPENEEAWANLGEALTSVGEIQQARACWIHASEHSKRPTPYLKKLALLAAEEKNVPETLSWVERLKAVMPEDELVEFLLAPSFSQVPQVLYLLD